MLHLPHLINDLGIILIVAAPVTLLFKILKQPVVLGYLIAGFLVSPYFPFFPSIAEGEAITIWAEIGVIFLLFALGLEFSFKKLKAVGGTASVTGVTEVIFMLAAGYLTGKLLGWNDMDSIFLGGILSISSTTIIIRAFDELGIKTKQFASVVFGVLIVEDLVAILLLVLLSTIAVTQQFQGAQLFMSSVKLVFFLSVWFIGGIFLLPSMLRLCKKYLNDEYLLILSIGLCLLMVILATKVGFSPALGAFVMGSLLAETPERKRIEHLIEPMKNFFGAIFFVSVGMLINPTILIQQWDSIIIISIVTVLGKVISSTLGSLISGETLKNSVQTGFSLAQIGEFSFIIATLGLTLKVTSEFLYPLAVAVSVITTFTTPYLIKHSGPMADKLESILPQRLQIFIRRYSTSTQSLSVSSQARTWLKADLTKITLLSLVILSIIFLSREFSAALLKNYFNSDRVLRSTIFILTFLVNAPFFWALFRGKYLLKTDSAISLRQNTMPYVIDGLRYLMVAVLLAVQIFTFLPGILSLIAIVLFSLIGYLGFPEKISKVYQWFEATFVENLNAASVKVPGKSMLLPWEAHLATYEVSPDADFLGINLESLKVRERYGVTIVLIERGHRRIKAPSRTEVLYPFDKISVVGTDEQLLKFKTFMELTPKIEDNFEVSDYGLKGCILTENSPFVGKTIRDSGIRESTEGLVVGMERNSRRSLNPDTTIVLQEGDLLWIVGNKNKLRDLI